MPGSINNRGEVAVLYTTAGGNLADRLGVWRDGTVTELALPTGAGPLIMGGLLNDRGQVAAAHISLSGGESFALRCTSATCARLPSPTGTTGPVVVTGIDELGRVAGFAAIADRMRAVQWSADGRAAELGTLGGRNSNPAQSSQSINVLGHVVGTSDTANGEQHAFLWRGGNMIDLGTLGGDYSAASAINDRGDVVGESRTADGQIHAFLWRAGQMTDLGTLGGDRSSAAAVNNAGKIVGYSTTPDGITRPVSWN